MATWRVCDKCDTGKDDKTVQTLRVENIGHDTGLPGVPEDLQVDLCRRHRNNLHTWLIEVETQAAR